MGRKDDLGRVERVLSEGGICSICPSLTGMRGIGKSQIAKAYAYDAQGKYDLIWWFNAKLPLDSQFKELGEYWNQNLNFWNRNLPVSEHFSSLDLEGDSQKVMERVRDALRKAQSHWLLIFDDAADSEFLRPYLPSIYSSSWRQHILATSKNSLGWGTKIELSVFEPEDSVDLLEEITQRNDRQGARDLAHELRHFPLAIAQAAAFISQSPGMTYGRYRDLFRGRRDDLWQREAAARTEASLPGYDDYERTFKAAFELSLEEVGRQSPFAIELLHLCAFLHHQDIPRTVFEGWTQGQERDVDLDLPADLRTLQTFSILTDGKPVLKGRTDTREDIPTYSLHELPQMVLKDKISLADRSPLFTHMLNHWTELWEEKKAEYGVGSIAIGINLGKVLLVNSEAYIFYPHLTAVGAHIGDIRELGLREKLIKEMKALQEVVEEVMDVTHTKALLTIIANRSLPLDNVIEQESILRLLSQALGSCTLKDCEYFLKRVNGLLPPNVSLKEGIEVMRLLWDLKWDLKWLGGSPKHRAEKTIEHQDLLEAMFLLNKKGLELSHCMPMFRSLTRFSANYKEIAQQANEVIREDMNAELRGKIIEAISRLHQKETDPRALIEKFRECVRASSDNQQSDIRVTAFLKIFPDPWEKFFAQVSELVTICPPGTQAEELMSVYSNVDSSRREEVLRCALLFRDNEYSTSDVIQIIETLGGLSSDRERIIRIALRHPGIKPNICSFMRALSQIPETEDLDDIIRHALPILKGRGSNCISQFLKIVGTISPEQRGHMMGIMKKIPNRSLTPDLLRTIIEILKPMSQADREDLICWMI